MEAKTKPRYNEVMKEKQQDRRCGLFVCLDMVHLGATPDGGVCDFDSRYVGLLKIECPLIIADDIISHENHRTIRDANSSATQVQPSIFQPIQTMQARTHRKRVMLLLCL